ncbi:hypothetical protein [Nitrosomonas sp.]|uniref:hypothetical protein n=1 Tax=Nitrosomonas sp. TaxID=42353 RepID=UPI0025DE9B94|nr:hypothetical protein [Nitrosomonas sp.]
MTKEHVQEKWWLYRSLTKIMFASINGRIILNHLDSSFPPFPENDPEDWGNWASAIEHDLSLDDTVNITDSALSTVTEALAATHHIAAAIMVDSPSEDIIESLTENIGRLNQTIRADQRFHAALDIGSAVADEIKRQNEMA